jgi:Ca-activated chloride channel family protein
VDIGRFSEQKNELRQATNSLAPRQGSPLFVATRDAYDTMRQGYDDTRINGVVMISDGHNEDDEVDDRAALLAHLSERVRIFTISYSSDADLSTLRRIAQATNARVYDANMTSRIADVYPAALSNF